jgi:hypothetical protein
MRSPDDPQYWVESAQQAWAEYHRLEAEEFEKRRKGEFWQGVRDQKWKAEHRAKEAESVARNMLGPRHAESGSIAEQSRRATREMEEAMRDIRRSRNERPY